MATAEEKNAPTVTVSTATSTPKLVLARPADRTLDAYKDWIKGLTAGVGGSVVDDPVKDSAEVWEAAWKDFWQRVDRAAATRASAESSPAQP